MTGNIVRCVRIDPQTRLGAVRLTVRDLDGMTGFYERTVGLRVLTRGHDAARLGAHGVGSNERAARDCDVVVATYDELIGFGLEDLAGKTLVTSAISDERLAELASRDVAARMQELARAIVERREVDVS